MTLNMIQETSAATAPVMRRVEALAILTAQGESYALATTTEPLIRHSPP